MFIDISSCVSSLKAYGNLIGHTFVLLWQYVQKSGDAKYPHFEQIVPVNKSLDSISRSKRRHEAPYPIRQSLSISPKRRPPSLLLPSRGCLVKVALAPRDLACILSQPYASVSDKKLVRNRQNNLLALLWFHYREHPSLWMKIHLLMECYLHLVLYFQRMQFHIWISHQRLHLFLLITLLIFKLSYDWDTHEDSGHQPVSLKGMSSWLTIIPQIPFYHVSMRTCLLAQDDVFASR